MREILFYRPRDSYGEFSNFAQYAIELDGLTWPTTEHYFQAQKFAGTEREEATRQAATPGEAARMGRDRGTVLRADWEDVKDEIMYQAVLAKFTQWPKLRRLLLKTGNAVLIEHTRRDAYWGDGGDGTGRNQLGKTLMRVREELREQG